MKQTSLYTRHQAAGATLVPFAGWDMPVAYGSALKEVQATRSQAGLFDISHMGEFVVQGTGALAFLQYVTTNDAALLKPNQAQYSLLLNENGGTIDDIIVCCKGDGDYLLVVNAGCKDKDWAWLIDQSRAFSNITLTDMSDQTALIAVQGPDAISLVSQFAETAGIPRFGFVERTILDGPCMLSRTGYTGEDGFEIFCPWDSAGLIWDLAIGYGAVPCGLGARDILRLEAAYPLYGHELSEETSALECGVGWAIKTGKGQFIGREAILTAKEQGAAQKLVGLKMSERAIPRQECSVLNDEGQPIGRVTSGTMSPALETGIAMARLARESSKAGSKVKVDIRGRQAAAEIVPLPFYRNGV